GPRPRPMLCRKRGARATGLLVRRPMGGRGRRGRGASTGAAGATGRAVHAGGGRMRSVCILVQNVYDQDIRVRRKAEALVAAGYTVDVVALRASPSTRRYTLNGVQVLTVPLGKKRGSPARYAFEYAAFFLWASLLVPLRMWRRRYDVID